MEEEGEEGDMPKTLNEERWIRKKVYNKFVGDFIVISEGKSHTNCRKSTKFIKIKKTLHSN